MAGYRPSPTPTCPNIGGGLSRIFLRGMASVRGHVGFSDMWINLRHTLLQRSEGPLFVSGYWANTDTTAHVYEGVLEVM